MTPRRARNGRSYAGGGQAQTELVTKDEYSFLVPYFPPDFYCDDLPVGLEALLQGLQGLQGCDGVDERGSPLDELLLVAGAG